MKTSINIHDFHKKFLKEYDFLYENRDNVAGYEEAVNEFDKLMDTNKSFRDFVGEFAKYRQDYITSDREAAAFMFAMTWFEK